MKFYNIKLTLGILFLSSLSSLSLALVKDKQSMTQCEYDQILKESYSKPAVIKFSTEWCGPCKTYKRSQSFEKASDNNSKINFYSVNADTSTVFSKLGLRSIPATVFIKNGQKVHVMQGALSEKQLNDLIATYLK